MKKLLTYSAVLASTVYLVGCGGGGSSSTAPANTTTTYKVTNKTGYDLQTVTVIDGKTGTEIQAGNLNCAAQTADCIYYYTGPKINGPDTLVFKNSSGSLVAAYVNGFDQTTYESIVVNDWNTGLYLDKKLDSTNENIAKLTQGDYEARWHRFTENYDSPDGAVDYYEEIAHYYAYESKVNKLSESAFIDRLGARLLKEEVADRSEFYNILLVSTLFGSAKLALNDLLFGRVQIIKPAYAAADTGAQCPAGLTIFMSFVGTVVGGVQNAFPLAGTVASVGLEVANQVCDSSSPSLADVLNKLNQIQTSLDNLHDKLGELKTLVANDQINDVLSRFGDVTVEANNRGKDFSVLLTGNSKSLLDVVKNSPQGNLDAYITKYPDGPLDRLIKAILVGKTDNLVTRIDAMTNEKFGTMVTAMKSICDAPTEGDVIKTRVQCNLAINTSMSRLIASQEVTVRIAKDVYDLAAAYPDYALNKYGYDSAKTAQVHYSDLKSKFSTQLTVKAKDKFKSDIKNTNNTDENGYYNTFDGLDKTLLTNMKDVACWSNKLGAAPITKWVKELNGKTVWLETNCPVGGTAGAPVLARYFLKLNDAAIGSSDVANVMGVLVEKRYVTGADFWFTGNRYTYSSEIPDFLMAFRNSGDAPVPGWFSVNNENGRGTNIVKPNINANVGRNLRRIAEEINGSFSGTGASLWTIDYYGGTSTTDYVKNWIRITDNAGYSTVFYLASGGTSARYIYFYCVTGDCFPSADYSGVINFEKSTTGLAFGIPYPNDKQTLPQGSYNAGSTKAPYSWFYESNKWLF